MAAEWRDIPGYEGLYKISTYGQIIGIKRKTLVGVNPASDGRLVVILSSGGKQKIYKVHYLVMLTFVGPRPAGHHIHHKNRDYKDNRIENLEYVSVDEHHRLHVEMRKATRPPVKPKPVKIPKPPPLRQQLITEIDSITNHNSGYDLHNLGLGALKDVLNKLKEKVSR